MKKVLVISSTFPRWKNDSTPGFIYNLSNLLAKKGYLMCALVPHFYQSRLMEKMNNIEVYRFKYFIPKYQKVAYGAGVIPNVKGSLLAKLEIPLFLYSEFISAKKIIEKEKINLIHAHWIIPHGLIGIKLKRKYKIPLIITIHGSDIFSLRNVFFRLLQKNIIKNCDVLTVNSEATKKEVLRRFPECKNKIKLIPMGVDLNFFKYKNVKKIFKQYGNNKIILFVGRLYEQKGVQYLIKAMPEISNNIKNAKLLIIGEGEYKNSLKKLSKLNKVEKNIEFLGAMPYDKIVDYYNLADVFVLPTIVNEALGLVLLEAMACKTAVIGTDTGGIKYIIKDGYNGFLVKEKNASELANKILKVLKDNKLKEKLEKNGVKFVRKNYSWQIIVKEFDKIYKSLLR